MWLCELGGCGCDLIEWLIFEEEYWCVDVLMCVNQNGIFLFGLMLMDFGMDVQKVCFLFVMVVGEYVWVQGWLELNVGLDMVVICMIVIWIGDEYVLNGQKIWLICVVWVDWLFGLFCSDFELMCYYGLMFLMVLLFVFGIMVWLICQLNGQIGFVEIFFDDVCVLVENWFVVEGVGWQVVMVMVGFECGLMLCLFVCFQCIVQVLCDLYFVYCDSVDCDLMLCECVVQVWMDVQVYVLLIYVIVSWLLKGGYIGVELSINKVFWLEFDLCMYQIVFDIFGVYGEVVLQMVVQYVMFGYWFDGFLFVQVGMIYVGINEIQCNIVVEWMFGMLCV